MLSIELCPSTGQEDGWLGVNGPRGSVAAALTAWAMRGSALLPFRDRTGTASVPLLLLWEVEITALSATCECCEDKHVKLCEVLR